MFHKSGLWCFWPPTPKGALELFFVCTCPVKFNLQKYPLHEAVSSTGCLVTPGVPLAELPTKSAVRTCGFSYSANTIMFSTDRTMGQSCTVNIYDIRDENQMRKFSCA